MLSQRNQINLIYLLCICLILISSCKENINKSTNQAEVSVQIKRFDKDLFDMNKNITTKSLDSLATKYNEFYNIYFGQIMNFGNPKAPTFQPLVNDFVNHPDLRALYADVSKNYTNLQPIEEELNLMFSNYQKLFPKDTLPEVATFISGFNNAVITSNKYVGIGLDMFMGMNYPYYASVDFPDYITRRLNTEYIIPSVAKAIVSAKYEQLENNPTFLDEMIYQGKILILIDQLLPEFNDTLKIGYTAEQLAWCKANESNIFKLFVDENVLFSSELTKYKKYIDEAPFTSGLANESAPRIGIWCGWQIMKKYMEQNKNSTIDEIMNEKDSQKILKLSQYKP